MSRSKNHTTDATTIADISGIVKEVVTYYRVRRMKAAEAQAEAAADLGISPRRVQDHVWSNVYSISLDEMDRIRAGHAAAVMQHAAWMENRARQLRARHDALVASSADDTPTAPLSVVRA